MTDIVLNKTELLEQSVGTASGLSAGTRIKFVDYPQVIRNVVTYGIIAHYSTDYSTSSNGNNIVDATEIAAAVLVLAVGGQENIRIPIYSLIPSLNGGLIRELANLNIDWDNSYILINNSSVFENNDTFAFTIIYKDKN